MTRRPRNWVVRWPSCVPVASPSPLPSLPSPPCRLDVGSVVASRGGIAKSRVRNVRWFHDSRVCARDEKDDARIVEVPSVARHLDGVNGNGNLNGDGNGNFNGNFNGNGGTGGGRLERAEKITERFLTAKCLHDNNGIDNNNDKLRLSPLEMNELTSTIDYWTQRAKQKELEYGNSKNNLAAKHADELLRLWLHNLSLPSSSPPQHLHSITQRINQVLDAWRLTITTYPSSFTFTDNPSLSLLHHLQTNFSNLTDAKSYTLVLETLALPTDHTSFSTFSSSSSPRTNIDTVKDALTILDTITLSPDTICCNAVLRLHARVASLLSHNPHFSTHHPNHDFQLHPNDLSQSALTILSNMQTKRYGTRATPDANTYAAVLQVLSSCGGRENALNAQRILDSLKKKWHSDDSNRLVLEAAIYEGVMEAWGNAGCGMDGLQRVLDLLDEMRGWRQSNDDVDGTTNTSDLDTDHHSDKDSSKNASYQMDIPEPTVNTYTTAIRAIATTLNQTKPNTKTRQTLLQKAQHLLQNATDTEGFATNTESATACYNALLTCWAKSHLKNAPHQAEALLRQMMDTSTNANDHGTSTVPPPDTASFNATIAAWSHSKVLGRTAPQRAQALLESMLQLSSAQSNHIRTRIRPNLLSFHGVIETWAKSGEVDGAERAEALLKKMQSLSQTTVDYSHLHPTVFTFNAVLHAWATSSQKNAVWRAEALLQQMLDLSPSPSSTPNPDRVTFGILIKAWSNSHDPAAAQHAEALLQRMKDLGIQPDTVCYSCVILAWSRCRDEGSGRRAERLLRQMIGLSERSCDGDGNAGVNSLVSPNVLTFTSVITALSRNREKDAAQKAIDLLQTMERLHATGQHPNAKPDTIVYNAVLSAVSRSKMADASDAAIRLLEQMGQNGIPTDTATYNTVLHALSKSQKDGSADRADALLLQMQNLVQSGENLHVKPDVVTFSNVVHAYGNDRTLVPKTTNLRDNPTDKSVTPPSNTLARIEALLRIMHDMDIPPDTLLFNTVLNVIRKSGDIPNKAHKAHEILLRMEHSFQSGENPKLQPDVRTYNAVIQACAARTAKHDTGAKRSALRIATEVFQKLQRTEHGPNQFSYDVYLKAVSGLSRGMERERLLRATFDMCCEDGRVDATVLESMHRFAPPDCKSRMYRSENDIPVGWRRNVSRT